MKMFAYLAGTTLPLAVMVYVGSYFGIWKRNTVRLPLFEAVGIFFLMWLITAGLILTFRVLLAEQDELTRSTVGGLWGPLIVGILIGRTLVSLRRKSINGSARS